MATTPTQVRLRQRPVGAATSETWTTSHDAAPVCGDGEIAVAVEYLSVDPAMRGWLNDTRSYLPPVGVGEVMRAIGVGKVVESRADALAVGDSVVGLTGVQTDYVGPATGFSKIYPELAPLPTFLGGLGSTGMTAYFGLLDIGQPREGETVVVSAAAGAVGSVVGQIARIKGCRVVGIAGGEDKCRYVVDELGFDACIDYKAQSVAEGLKQHCPDRIDLYFDNVGGAILEACLNGLANKARIVLCGAISQYNATGGMAGPANYMQLLIARARMEGFVVFDYLSRFPEAIMQMAQWRAEGKLILREHVINGIEQFPQAFDMLFTGENTGKLVIRV